MCLSSGGEDWSLYLPWEHHLLMPHSVPDAMVRVFHVLAHSFLTITHQVSLLLCQVRQEKANAAERLGNGPKLSELVRGRAEARHVMSGPCSPPFAPCS